MAYSNFDFDKPAKIKDVGVLDQNVVVPDSLHRSNGRALVCTNLHWNYLLQNVMH